MGPFSEYFFEAVFLCDLLAGYLRQQWTLLEHALVGAALSIALLRLVFFVVDDDLDQRRDHDRVFLSSMVGRIALVKVVFVTLARLVVLVVELRRVFVCIKFVVKSINGINLPSMLNFFILS